MSESQDMIPSEDSSSIKHAKLVSCDDKDSCRDSCCDEKDLEQSKSRIDGVCDDCLAVPWEKFGTSDSSASFTAREPFMSWKYIVPKGHTWPASRHCRVCSFLRRLLFEHNNHSTTHIRKLHGGWDEMKPVKMTYLEIDIEGGDRYLSGNSDDSDDDVYTVWNDDSEGTTDSPSFFATSLGVKDFQTAMSGYRPTDAGLSVVKTWLDECSNAHGEKCQPLERDSLRNLQVIDCDRRAIVPAPPDCSFVALSYVWGPPSAQPDLTSSVLVTQLPQTIEDSILVTKELGFSYLWIDRYCIDQENTAEKQEQIEQMANIYASAAVTIIATAGQDPSHGLPGIQHGTRGLCRYEQVRSVRLFENPYIHPRNRYPPFYVHESKWATRAWTFQEGYNSPRRLFFTDEQITLMCNTVAYQETAGAVALPPSHPIHTNLRGWISASGESPVPEVVLKSVPHPLARIMDIVNVYSQRQMSYDSDALNAILGTLETFHRHDIHHLWGVPVWLPRCDDTVKQGSITAPGILPEEELCFSPGETKSGHSLVVTNYPQLSAVASASKDSIALFWYNHSPRYRRAGFPSWSPLGWTEGSQSLARQGIGWFTRQTPPATGSNFITLLAACTGIVTLPDFKNITDRSYRETGYQNLGADTQRIRISAPTIDLRLALDYNVDMSDERRTCIATKLAGNVDVLLPAFWDKRSWQMGFTTCLKGLVITVANSGTCCADSTHWVMLVLERHEGHWERVAIAPITSNFLKSTVAKDEATCDFTPAKPQLFRKSSTGAILTWDARSDDYRSSEVLDLSHIKLDRNEPWWLGCSKWETTIIG